MTKCLRYQTMSTSLKLTDDMMMNIFFPNEIDEFVDLFLK